MPSRNRPARRDADDGALAEKDAGDLEIASRPAP